MKKFIYTITSLIAFTVAVDAQVGIETEAVSDKAILDFPDNANGGILLPYVETPVNNSIQGTLKFNANTGAIDLLKDEGWTQITPAWEDQTNVPSHELTELNSNGVAITDTEEPTVPGVLVLESNDKALALPKVDSVDNIQSPKAGMICYDISRKALAIFNGKYWFLRN